MARPQEFSTAEVLRKAMGVFWKKGYEATSLNDLLAATGLSKSSLYGTFGGKQELFLAAFDAYREERARDMQRVLEQGPARQAIEVFFRMIVSDARDPAHGSGCMSINQAVELAPHNLDVRCRVEEDFRRIEDALTRAIEKGQAEKSVASHRAPRDLARLLVLAFPGLQVMVRAGTDPAWLESSLAQLMSLLE
ncbi:TetR/AcrR family transcriptional regulator [Roseomonas sp. SSH11]|uniref:TetR/AcrR family transcriptional regulator n=1 Tax=Pararoseomonas baculiformis TaxID=2820812 RepID=A0ABS4AKV9_9PROT|nr:TetR/AcrR family transcriptional regulator [Pararoseomonas baculiformis]MBP0447506.1 TetR/AcrR family transcriptional regulator [Pararoseomonas baculiformis]